MLETERLILREWRDEDASRLAELLNDLSVSKWLPDVPYPFTYADAEEYINAADKSGSYFFAVTLKESGEIIGGTSIEDISEAHKTAGGGVIWLASQYRGMGYGAEAFSKRAEFAFCTLGLRKLKGGYFSGNEPSWSMQKKLGYKQEGLRRKQYICRATGETVDEVLTGLLYEEWIGII